MKRKGRAVAALAAAGMVSLSLTALAPAQAQAVAAAGGVLASARPLNLPPGAVPGSTPGRRAAWNALSPAQQRQVVASFERDVTPKIDALVAAPPKAVAGTAPGAGWKSLLHSGAHPTAGPAPTFTRTTKPAAGANAVRPLDGTDGDGDGLPDDFEQNLADAFTPVYHVSAGEAPGTGFAIFEQNVPTEVVQSVTGPVPPASYFAVTPLGVATTSTGQPVEAIRLDYFTLWNEDDGLQIDDTCSVGLDVTLGLVGVDVGLVLDGASSHYLDNERSAALVAAPLNADGSIDFNPGDYSAYSYYTAAHEGTFLDHSAYLNPGSPVPAYNHLNLALSLSKHSTYTFNPDGMPIMPDWVISAVYATITSLWADGEIDDATEALYLYLADTVFYSCIIEHFGDQGGSFAQTRINVGEPGAPLNGSAFIADPLIAPKFAPLW
jgi:hypothetical protein